MDAFAEAGEVRGGAGNAGVDFRGVDVCLPPAGRRARPEPNIEVEFVDWPRRADAGVLDGGAPLKGHPCCVFADEGRLRDWDRGGFEDIVDPEFGVVVVAQRKPTPHDIPERTLVLNGLLGDSDRPGYRVTDRSVFSLSQKVFGMAGDDPHSEETDITCDTCSPHVFTCGPNPQCRF